MAGSTSQFPDYKFLDDLTYHSKSDQDFPTTIKNRRQSIVLDSKGRLFYVDTAASSGIYGSVRKAYLPASKQAAFVVKELYRCTDEKKLAANKERAQLVKAWGVCGFKIASKIRFFMPDFGEPLSKILPTIKDNKTIIILANKMIDKVIFWHDQKMTHGDLHRNNILIKDGDLELCDAGLSCDFDEKTSGLWRAHTIHIAPELRTPQPAGPEQDAWAVGQLFSPYYGFGEVLRENKSILTAHFKEIGFALTRLNPTHRISLPEARKQLQQLLDLYSFLKTCYKDKVDIKQELDKLKKEEKYSVESALILAIQSQSVLAVELLLEEKVDLSYVHNNETILMLALRKYHQSPTSKTIYLTLLSRLDDTEREKVLEISYACIKKLSPYEQFIYFEKWTHNDALKAFLLKKEETWDVDAKLNELLESCIENKDFITLKHFIVEAPQYIVLGNKIAHDACFKWLQKCIETNDITALEYLTAKQYPDIFKDYIQSEHTESQPAICLAASLGHFSIVELLEEHKAHKTMDFIQCMENGLETLGKKGILKVLKEDENTFWFFRRLPLQDSSYIKTRAIIENIVKEGIKELIEKNETSIKKIGIILDCLPSSFLQGMGLIKSLNLGLAHEKLIQSLRYHPRCNMEVVEWLDSAMNAFIKQGDYKNFGIYLEKFGNLIAPKAELDKWVEETLLNKLNCHFKEKNLDAVKQIKTFFPAIYNKWLQNRSKERLMRVYRENWLDGMSFLLGEDKDMKIDASSFVNLYLKFKEYEAVNHLMQSHPRQFPAKLLLPKMLKCIYFGNLEELKALQEKIPDAFNACLIIPNNGKKNILDILEKEDPTFKYSKGLALFTHKKSLKAEINNFSCDVVTQDKMLRVAKPAKYSEIHTWLTSLIKAQVHGDGVKPK